MVWKKKKFNSRWFGKKKINWRWFGKKKSTGDGLGFFFPDYKAKYDKMQQCKGICKTHNMPCTRKQKAEYCHHHHPKPLGPLSIKVKFDFSENANFRKLHQALKEIPWKQFSIEWQTGNTFVLVKPITGLTPCAHPQQNVFRPQNMDKRNKHAYSMLSNTGNSRLVIPFRPYSHLQCFVHEASVEEFDSLFRLTQHFGRKARRPVRVFTEGLEVGWLHVKIR